MMTKRITFLSLLLMSLSSVSVQAMPKIDATKITQKVMEEVGKVQEEAQKIQTQLGNLTQLQQFKDAAGEFNKMKGKLDDAKKKVGDVKKTVNDVKDKAGEVQQSVADAQNSVGNLQNSATNSLGDLQNGLGGDGAQQLLSLQTELAQSQQNLTNDLSALDDELQARIKSYQDNNLLLQKEIDSITQQLEAQANNQGSDFIQDNRPTLQRQIDANNAEIKKIQDEFATKRKEKQDAFNQAKSQLNEKMNKLKDLAGNVDLNNMNFESAQKALSGFFGSGGSAAMSATMQKNFYAEDEQSSPKRDGEIDAYRKKVALDDTADVYARAVKMMSYGDKYIVSIHDLEMNAPQTETTPAGIMLEISAKVEQMKILLNYAYLSVAELKMTTALDMVSLPKHLNNPSKDPSAFNLDDYRDFKAAAEKKKGGLSGFIDNVKGKVSELKDKYGDDVMNAIDAAKEAKSLYEDASAASSLVFGGSGGGGSDTASSAGSTTDNTTTGETITDNNAVTRSVTETVSAGTQQAATSTGSAGYSAPRSAASAYQTSTNQAPLSQNTQMGVGISNARMENADVSSKRALEVNNNSLKTGGSFATVAPQIGQRQAFSLGAGESQQVEDTLSEEGLKAEAAGADSEAVLAKEDSSSEPEKTEEEPSLWNKIQQKLGIGTAKQAEIKDDKVLKTGAEATQAPLENSQSSDLLKKEPVKDLTAPADLKIKQEAPLKAVPTEVSDKKELKASVETKVDSAQKAVAPVKSLEKNKIETPQTLAPKTGGRSAFTMPKEVVSNGINKGLKQEKAQ